jgi:asparagine synthase (glutamine-hydrolysing)
MVFNGEIYNFATLRHELQQRGHLFHGHSDTEVMLAGFSEWGILTAVKKFNGMFAFALWDVEEQTLYLGRDRLGEKPLYYGWAGQTLLFGSELKTLKMHPAFSGELDRSAVDAFLCYGYVPAPYSIYKGIYKLPPGNLLRWQGEAATPTLIPYWTAKTAAEQGEAAAFAGSEREAIAQLENLLADAVQMRMVADVPLGAFLSGGIDSSMVVALMQAHSNRPIQTFTIGFEEETYNEAVYAKAVAQHLGTNHTELYVKPEEAMAVIPKLPILYDEPFADASQIPTFLVAQLARQQVTVSLSGDGGDELFAGYSAYVKERLIWNQIGWLSPAIRQMLAQVMGLVTPHQWHQILKYCNAVLSTSLPSVQVAESIHTLAKILASATPEDLHMNWVSHWCRGNSNTAFESNLAFGDRQQWATLKDFTHQMMHLDMITFLPDEVLVKVDRATMGVSLESRAPYLDHRVVELAWQLPLSMKIKGEQGKWILRKILEKYVPLSLIDRPKTGFNVPIDQWLQGSLRGWAEELLDKKHLDWDGLLQPAMIRRKWQEHVAGDRDWQHYLWRVLMFQAWRFENL